jgi:hypothetical protein
MLLSWYRWIKDWFVWPDPSQPGVTRSRLAESGVVQGRDGHWYFLGNRLSPKQRSDS